MDFPAASPLESVAQFLGTSGGKLVLVLGAVALIGALGAITGYAEGRHPELHVANVFSVPLEVRAGEQIETVPAHGSVSIKLKDKDSPVRIVYQGREVDSFSAPYKFNVLNVLGAAPIVRQEVEWRPSTTKKDMMDGISRQPKGTYCGARVIDPMDADDILRAKPDVIVLTQGASDIEIRRRLNFPASASPFECVHMLEGQRKTNEASKIRAFATSLGEVEARQESAPRFRRLRASARRSKKHCDWRMREVSSR